MGTHKIWPATMRPKRAPCENAWRAFVGAFFCWPRSTVTWPRVTGSSISGIRIFEIAMDAGIDMTDAVTKFSGGTPMPMYALSTEPAMVEKPAAPRVSVRDGGGEDGEEGEGRAGGEGAHRTSW